MHLAPPSLSLSSYFLPFSSPYRSASLLFIARKETGEEEEEEEKGDGDGDEERGQESMKGGAERGCKRERKMIVRVCQWELNPLTDSVSVPLILSHAKASLFIQSFRDTHLHCMKILAASFICATFLSPRLLLLWC